MFRIVIDVFRRPALDDLARIHHVHAVRIAGNNAEIVGDDNHRNAQFTRQVLHQLQNLRLNCNVECRCRFIGNDEFRLAAQRHRDHDTLAHTAAEMVRILFQTPFSVRHTNQSEKLNCARVRRGIVDT